MQQEADVSIDVVRIIQSMVLLFVAADAIVRYVFRIRGRGRPAPRRPGDRMEQDMSDAGAPIPTTLGMDLDRGSRLRDPAAFGRRQIVGVLFGVVGLVLLVAVAPNLPASRAASRFEPPPDPLAGRVHPRRRRRRHRRDLRPRRRAQLPAGTGSTASR